MLFLSLFNDICDLQGMNISQTKLEERMRDFFLIQNMVRFALQSFKVGSNEKTPLGGVFTIETGLGEEGKTEN
jgi:hypothetical protein